MNRSGDSQGQAYGASASRGRVPARSAVDHEFDRARRAAFIHDILAPLRNQPLDLLPFEEVRKTLRLGSQTYRGHQNVSLDHIVGSVARYHDFGRAFKPRRDSLRQRWQRVMTLRGRLPPIDLYKVGEVFFVVDGNHRVSVARQAGATTIEAHVWEYETRVPVEPNDDLNDIFIRQEYQEFLAQSHLDINRPDQRIVFTVPGRYRQLGEEMAQHREWLDRQHIYTVSFEEAAADWFDTIYKPMAEVIRAKDALAEFPGRTEADLVAYILRYRDELHQQWAGISPAPSPSLVDADPLADQHETDATRRRSQEVAQAFIEESHRDWWGRFTAWVKRRILRWQILDGKSGDDTP